jgi:paired amphipathic helix protein Sin3a
MRELRVEDALLYLDQVKVEFGDRPHIYNEFLDIMKTFKTQQIDTPGVIRRVSNLFQGNRRLVLGFNTFLPEGYKIELPENGDGPPVAVYRTPHSDQAYAVTGPNAGRPAGTQPFASPGNGTGAYPGGSMDSKPAARPLGQPSLAGPGAIPPGQRGTLGQSQAGGGFVGGQPAAMPPRGMNQPGHSMAGLGPHSQPPMQPSQAAAAPAAGPPPGTQAPMEFDHAINYVTTIKKRFSNEPETYKKFLEILHTYQKEQRGIKEVLDEVSVLFSEHPDLLKEFTYFLPDAVQAQAKAQLDAVAKESEERQRARLANQQIMQQAQGVQNRAMPQGSPQNSIPMMSPRPSPPKRAPIPFGATQARSEEMEKEISRSAVYGDVSFDPVRPPLIGAPTVAQAVAKGTRPSVLPRLPPQPTTAETAFFEKAKRHLLRRELAAERTHGPRRNTPYAEFLKCLHMFGAGILSKDELILLLRGLFMQGHAPKSGLTASGAAIHADVASDAHDLLRELEEILIGRGPYARQEMLFKDKSKYGATPSCEFEMKDGEERPTPSYVTYPPDYPSSLFFNNSGQTDGDTAVLNESLACVGDENKSRSIEDSDAVAKRRNAYEQALFRIEDERFEVDMAIERNAHAMRQIEPIAEEVKNLRDRDEKDGMPIGRLQYKLKSRSLNSIHINAIGRIYGDSGDEVIEHLARNPLAVLPIVYQRLRQKDQEWRKQRSELLAKWKKGNEDNYEGSRDFLGHKARKDLERGFTTEQLHRELKEAKKCYAKPQEFMNSPVDFGLSNFDTAAVLYQPYCVIDMKPKSSVHYHAVKLVIRLMKSMNLEPAEREKVGRIWAEFMLPFYEYPANWVADEVRESFRGKISNNVVKCKSSHSNYFAKFSVPRDPLFILTGLF